MREVTLEDIKRAAEVIKSKVHRTPLERSQTFSMLAGGEIYLKAENLQKTGSFKSRGAINKIASLNQAQLKRGVIAASTGNHAQGVAYAASLFRARCTIVMPENTSISKILATRGYGARVILKGKTFSDALKEAKKLAKEEGLCLIHAFDDPHIIAGQGTIALEILEDLPEVEQIVVPVGGGGLISGIAIAAKSIKEEVKVIGVQAEAVAAMKASLAMGKPTSVKLSTTIADGIAIKSPGRLTFQLIQRYVDDVVTVTEEEIAEAMLLLLERAKLVAEGAGAASLAACLSGKVPCKGKTTAVLISGGNVDLNLISRVIEKGLVKRGRYLHLSVVVKDLPGELKAMLETIAEKRANVISVVHDRLQKGIPLGEVRVDVVVETYGFEHAEEIKEALIAKGYLLL
jgi:threonine dehydratase